MARSDPLVGSIVDLDMAAKSSESKRDSLQNAVVAVWRDKGHTEGTIAQYLKAVKRYRLHCRRLGVDESERLTRRHADRFAKAYARRRGRDLGGCVEETRSALHAWANAVAITGSSVPDWTPPKRAGPFDEILTQYDEFGRRYRGVKVSTLRREGEVITRFLRWLRRSRQPISSITPTTIDRFLVDVAARSGAVTMSGVCSRLRSFLRFMHATGMISVDLSGSVIGPAPARFRRPPQVVPWRDVRRVLQAIDRRTTLGKRDYAATLLMATYGMGGAEVLALRLDDIDWDAGTVRIRRPKTGVQTIVPLIGPVGQALTSYLQRGRPRHSPTRAVFVRGIPPYISPRIDALRVRLQRYATAAGVCAARFGPHTLRRSHVCRQIEAAAPSKVVSDILGHEDPRSISVYARVATERLREVCLPWP